MLLSSQALALPIEILYVFYVYRSHLRVCLLAFVLFVADCYGACFFFVAFVVETVVSCFGLCLALCRIGPWRSKDQKGMSTLYSDRT